MIQFYRIKNGRGNVVYRIFTRSQNKSDFQFHEKPSISDFDVPDGFYAISTSQAMMKYAEPIFEFTDESDTESLNTAMQMAMVLWNYQIAQKEGIPADDKIKDDIVKNIKKTLCMNTREAEKYFQQMIARKNYLFPPDIQPKASMTMYIRKEVSHLIAKFNYDQLDISGNSITLDQEDKEMVLMINQMDQYIASGANYDDWEKHYLSMEKECAERFHNWLIAKGIKKYSNDFPFYLNAYLNFIYRYGHDEFITLKSVPSIYFEEFFSDHLLRKVMVEPHEYSLWPPAMKLFYRFLYEKDYLDDAEPLIKQITEIEQHFIEILRERFG